MGDQSDPKNELSRRNFMEKLGVTALAVSQLLTKRANAQGPEASKTLPWSEPPALTNPNILLIMVDQMRWPDWLDNQTQEMMLDQQILPNIFGRLRDNSYVFNQYYTAATICTASRGTLLTGLYAPQTHCYCDTMETPTIAPLLPQFNTWGEGVPAVNPAYKNNLWWFGKWHLSDCTTTTPLIPYGFNTRTYPGGAAKNPSPDGSANEGTDGGQFGPQFWASDADIANDFVGWITGQPPTSPPATPWCACVSLINPHDIGRAPAWLEDNPFPPVDVPMQKIFFDPPPFPPLSGAPAMYSANPTPWNYENLAVVTDKPSAQYEFQSYMNHNYGTVSSWVTFLNWYYWLQNYVDQQVGVVLNALAASTYAANTIILFTSDHGEHGGSHGLHDKGATLYDEAIHVPFYVQYPGQVGSIVMNQMCSSVDVFGLMCDLAAHGNGQWKTKYPDLASRQSFWSFLYKNSAETRISEALGVPYILNTCDQTNIIPNTPFNHIVGLRTKYQPTLTSQPGAKLGVYSEWGNCTTLPNATPPQYEFYDYNPATGNNTYELGNDYYSTNPKTIATLAAYQGALGSFGPPAIGLIATELDPPLVGTGPNGAPLTEAQATAQLNYMNYLWGPGCE